MPPDNAKLLEVVARPLRTVEDVIAVFEEIEHALPDSDGLKWFNGLYLNVTKAVDQSIGTLHWNNPAWLIRLDVIFAGLYLSALTNSLTPGMRSPGCWQVLFDARHDSRLARIQFALGGMNAHINHDLCIAVVQTCREMQIEPVHLSPEYQDYTQVNQLLDGLINSTKHELMVGLLGDALPSIDRVEDLVGAFGILASREIAWTNSELLWQTQAVPGLSSRFLAGLDSATRLAGAGLLAPVGI
jgi:hypothetical protein